MLRNHRRALRRHEAALARLPEPVAPDAPVETSAGASACPGSGAGGVLREMSEALRYMEALLRGARKTVSRKKGANRY